MPLSFGSLYHMASNGMMARQLDLDSISNNIANIHTAGYKQSRINFQELLSDNEISGTNSVCSQVGTSQGVLSISTNPMDWGIEGAGFYGIKMENGTLGYTRDGSFNLDSAGNIVTGSGNKLDWTGTIPKDADMVNVGLDGKITARVNGAWTDAGNVKLTIFNNPTGLESVGGNIWKETPASGTAKTGVPGDEDFGQIRGYTIESSTVDISEEISHMIRTQRGFQSASRALEKTDSMVSLAIRMRQG